MEDVKICYLDFQEVFDHVSHRLPDHKVRASSVNAGVKILAAYGLKGKSFRVGSGGVYEKQEWCTTLCLRGLPNGPAFAGIC